MDPDVNLKPIIPNSYNFTLRVTETGKNGQYSLDVRDQWTDKQDSVEIEWRSIPFTFSGNSESNSSFLKLSAPIQF